MTTQSTQKQFPKRDFLVQLELKYQKKWEDERVFEQDAGEEQEKYMATFPYPYMNGMAHMGHSFSVSKPEFQVGYQRMLGKKCLFPMGFHVTGMPIKACADKLKKEIVMFGPDFKGYKGEENEKDDKELKTSKQKTKSTGLKYQFQIMKASGVPDEEIHKFADSTYWIYYFPQQWQRDLKRFGIHVDWRRSFFTTDKNPYYDSFIRWQFNQLKKKNKVLFGERYTIYSPVDGQACLDHDRASGEGVGVQEYTGIKLQVLLDELAKEPKVMVNGKSLGQALLSSEFQEKLVGKTIYMVAATLRPETMYGQTNCYVGVDLEYGVYQVSPTEAWICTHRSARNMAYQSLFEKKGEIIKLFDLTGWDLVGVPLKAPLASYEKVYTLPMEGVLATKGTGVVTSVPSDSPDDYITLLDLQKKSAYYQIQESWVTPFLPPKPIIQTANFGNLAAVAAVEKLRIQSQKDKKQLAEAKEMVYKDGFYTGTIIVGEFAGKSVQDAKPLIKQYLVDQKLGFVYCEPEGLVISRSGDECVVAMEPQWYMDYGEETWKQDALECIQNMELFTEDSRNQFVKNLDWLKQWACSRKFGLGSRLPWDKEWLIESLSDSTIYMAYYTVSHILHGGNLDGSSPSEYNILAQDMTDEVWSFIMQDGSFPKDTKIPKETLNKMKKEFNYFYPLDLRTSGKDLINNHLTFFIYNHVAIFNKDKWPKAIRPNGHLLLNNEKMSKSTGNFLTLRECMDRYGADATRFALADAGDGLEDANFLEKTADDAILKLFTEREFIEETLNDPKIRSGEWTWNDKVFDAEINRVIIECQKAYDKMWFREAIKIGFYDLQHARNEYRKATTGNGMTLVSQDEVFENMHIDLLKRFAQIQALLLSPITPHWSESIWIDLLKNEKSIMHARWPETKPLDKSLLASATYIRELGSKIRSTEDQLAKKKKKGTPAPASTEPKKMVLYVAQDFPKWQEDSISILKATFVDGKFNGTERALLKEHGLEKDKRVMPFIAMIKRSVEQNGPIAFDRHLEFSELDALEYNMDFLRRDLAVLKVSDILVVKSSTVEGDEEKKKAETAVPGSPAYRLVQ